MALTFMILEKRYAVCRAEPGATVQQSDTEEELWSVTVSPEEVSVVLPEQAADPSWKVEPGWRALRIKGPLDFELKGVLAAVSGTLSDADISLFVISTYETDYVLVKEENLEKASSALINDGHEVVTF